MVSDARPLFLSSRPGAAACTRAVPSEGPSFIAQLGFSAGLAASSRMLEAVQLATRCIDEFRPRGTAHSTRDIRVVLFYIDCEVYSALGRPVTELPWTRAA